MTERYDQEAVDEWVAENDEFDAYNLFDECLPKHRAKLYRLDKRIQAVLAEIQKTFPDAQYYTQSGGFSLVLGGTHDEDIGGSPQQQRSAWIGGASISDGDW